MTQAAIDVELEAVAATSTEAIDIARDPEIAGRGPPSSPEMQKAKNCVRPTSMPA